MRLHHIGIAVSNIKKSIDKYRQIGYICESGLVYDYERNVNIVFMTNGETRIELIEKGEDSRESPVDNMVNAKNKHYIYHTCYLVKDIDDEISRLKGMNFVLICNPKEAIALNQKKVCFMYHVDVGMIELLEA